jgi:hypothetical protein
LEFAKTNVQHPTLNIDHPTQTIRAVKRRWAWNIFCALSLLTFATSMTLCIRSYFFVDAIGCTLQSTPNRSVYCSLATSRGAVRFIGSLLDGPHPADYFSTARYAQIRPAYSMYYGQGAFLRTNFNFAGLQFVRFQIQPFSQESAYARARMDTLGLILPLWLFLIFAVPPLLWWRKRRKRLGGRGFPVAAARDGEVGGAHRRQT